MASSTGTRNIWLRRTWRHRDWDSWRLRSGVDGRVTPAARPRRMPPAAAARCAVPPPAVLPVRGAATTAHEAGQEGEQDRPSSQGAKGACPGACSAATLSRRWPCTSTWDGASAAAGGGARPGSGAAAGSTAVSSLRAFTAGTATGAPGRPRAPPMARPAPPHAHAVFVAHRRMVAGAQEFPGVLAALGGGLAEPLHGLFLVAFHAGALVQRGGVVHLAQRAVVRIAAHGGAVKQLRGLDRILGHAIAVLVHQRLPDHGTHVAGGDALVEHLVGGLVVAALFQQVAGAQVTGRRASTPRTAG